MGAYRKIIENGVAKLQPFGGANSSGLPLGAILPFYGTVVPVGFMLCDGSTFDTTAYSSLFYLLGSNHLPDLRECVPVGAGATDRAITNHDVYTLGQFKDAPVCGTSGTATQTHGKQLGVNWIIKAVSGMTEDSAETITLELKNYVDSKAVTPDWANAVTVTNPVVAGTFPYTVTGRGWIVLVDATTGALSVNDIKVWNNATAGNSSGVIPVTLNDEVTATVSSRATTQFTFIPAV